LIYWHRMSIMVTSYKTTAALSERHKREADERPFSQQTF